MNESSVSRVVNAHNHVNSTIFLLFSIYGSFSLEKDNIQWGNEWSPSRFVTTTSIIIIAAHVGGREGDGTDQAVGAHRQGARRATGRDGEVGGNEDHDYFDLIVIW